MTQKPVKEQANELYEFFEKDYSDYKSSKISAIDQCDVNIRTSILPEEKVFWIDVKTELKNNY